MLVVTFDGQTFSFEFDIADPAQFSALLREILDWRMAQYLLRTGTAERTEDVICRVSQNSTGNPILFLPSKDTGGSPTGHHGRLGGQIASHWHKLPLLP